MLRVIVASAFALGACSSGGSGTNADGQDSGGANDTTTPPDDCYTRAAGSSDPQKCANDGDCGGGSRCDKALSPPLCVQLYCLPIGSACSDDVQCQTGDKCIASKCATCTPCGSQCVDLQSDPNNCGACGNAVGDGNTCSGGKIATGSCNTLDVASAPVVSVESVDGSTIAAPPASALPADGTYVLTGFKIAPGSSCFVGGSPKGTFQWVIQLSGGTSQMARIQSTNGVVQRISATVTFDSAGVAQFSLTCGALLDMNNGTRLSSSDALPISNGSGGGFRSVVDGCLDLEFAPM